MRGAARRRPVGSVAIIVALVLSVGQPAAGDVERANFIELLPDSTLLHPDIAAQVEVDLRLVAPLAAELSTARNDELDAALRVQGESATIASLLVAEQDVRAAMVLAKPEAEAARIEVAKARGELGSFVVGTFVTSTAVDLERFSTELAPSPIPTLSLSAEEVLVENRTRAEDASDRAEAALADLVDQLSLLLGRRADAEEASAQTRFDRQEAESRIARLVPSFEAAVLTAPVVGADFTVVVLDAYYRAALRTATDAPGCEVQWHQLAGIGRVESRHGTYGGTSVGADGRTGDRIVGSVLDGTAFASIPDTDKGRHDGDALWDRAVGPMQFIPSSWQRFGTDGNDDGVIDPHNMYDAAQAAAAHLCATSGGLADRSNYRRALLGYNRSVAYGDIVMAFADAYRTDIDLRPSGTSVAEPDVSGFEVVGVGVARLGSAES